MAETTALVAVAGGASYRRYAERLMESAREFFKPTPLVELLILEGEEGWPQGTLCRHERLLASFPTAQYIYLVDADMRFEAPAGPIILPPDRGITATLHPGYVATTADELPYERDPASACAVPDGDGTRYFCGGFFGGERAAMHALLTNTCRLLDTDAEHGHATRWQDESALNRVLASWPPQRILDPSYCYPDRDGWYRGMWTKRYERILVALDKTREERGER
jgi:Glycosyltransferase family 6